MKRIFGGDRGLVTTLGHDFFVVKKYMYLSEVRADMTTSPVWRGKDSADACGCIFHVHVLCRAVPPELL